MGCKDHMGCVETALNVAAEKCLSNGWRLTPIRKRVLELIWQSHRAVKAYDLLEILQQESSTAKPPTVYRAIDFLLDAGLVHKINSLNAFVGCSHPTESHRCMFLLCEVCGHVEECCQPALKHEIDHVALESGYKLRKISVELTGVCGECQK